MALENIYDGLTEEQKAKAKGCATPEKHQPRDYVSLGAGEAAGGCR